MRHVWTRVCEGESMSLRGSGEPESFGIQRALNKMKSAGPDLGLIERAREARRVLERKTETDVLEKANRDGNSRTAVRQDGLELWPLPGLAPMTRVRTSFGDVHAAALRKGDEVLTRSGEHKRIVWLNRIRLDEHILSMKPDSNPIVIPFGALGPNAPSNEILVSPRQLICSDEINGLNRDREASMLISRTGIRRLRETSMSYTMFHVGEVAEVYCEGIYLKFPTEA